MLHLEKVIRGALNMLTDLVPVRGSPDQRPQDKHVQRAEKKIYSLLRRSWHSRRSTLVEMRW